MKMIQRFLECMLFCVLAGLSLYLLLWFKSVCFSHQWLNYKTSGLGFDGLIAWLCMMLGFRHFHIWLVGLFGKTSMFTKTNLK